MEKFDITICSVSFYSKSYIDISSKLIHHLNPSIDTHWIVVENTPKTSPDRIDSNCNEYTIYDGFDFDSTKKRAESYHHALALNFAVQNAKTRYLMILDPDFYIIRRNSIVDVLDYIQELELSFFGVPYHPKWYNKYRYFPTGHCLFIDLERIDSSTLDFLPEVVERAQEPIQQRYRLLQRVFKNNVVRAIYLNIKKRGKIGASRDTGYDIYERYRRDTNIRYECLVPVYRPLYDYIVPPFYNAPTLASATKTHRLVVHVSKLLDRLLPDYLSYSPKDVEYYTEIGFPELGYTQIALHGWEEFMWKGSPFGFHLRGQRYFQEQVHAKPSLSSEINVLRQVITNLTQEDIFGCSTVDTAGT